MADRKASGLKPLPQKTSLSRTVYPTSLDSISTRARNTHSHASRDAARSFVGGASAPTPFVPPSRTLHPAFS
ncbi:hypothetical protein [Lysobacter gummosus]|uniref:hypothetical protein n=1 Tax=Lysobacter gummosus TaxID=262324 RepID=UPI0036305099